MAIAVPQPGCGVVAAGEALALPAVLTEQKAAKQQISVSAEGVMRTIYSALENVVSLTIEKRTTQDFTAQRGEVYPAYYQAVLALPAVIRVVIPENALDIWVRESFCEMESDLREHGLTFFGSAVRDQAMFTVWTLRKITEMFGQIPRDKTLGEPTPKAAELLNDFVRYGVWTRFHLHCLVTSMRLSKPIHPEPLVEIINGLRAAVNAYAFARRIVDILAPRTLSAEPAQEWDAEDEALLAEANMEMLSEEA